MTPRLYVLTGASGSGKTTLLNNIAAVDELHVDPKVKAIRAPKFSERSKRQKDGELDDITHVSQIELGDFDIAYVINRVKYGIKLNPIRELLTKGLNPFIVLSDFRVVRQLKNLFGKQVRCLYVSSAIDPDRLRRIQLERLGFQPTDNQKTMLSYHFARASAASRLGWWDRVSDCMFELEADWHAYASDAKSTEVRAQRIRAFHIRYIEHLHMFDHVILNYSENNPDEMTTQARNLIVSSDRIEQSKKKHPPIFVVAAASGAGKGTLMEMLHFIGRDKVQITSKLAKRALNVKDKRDGMIALKRTSDDAIPEWPKWWSRTMIDQALTGSFPTEYDLYWEFHKKSGARGTQYAVSHSEIQRNLIAGIPQILVSNMDQFSMFRTIWPENVVFVYLHRLVSDHDNREFQIRNWKDDPVQAQIRIEEKKDVHEAYIRNISEFDHVLLNTGFEEDLYDQMFGLLEHYSSPTQSISSLPIIRP